MEYYQLGYESPSINLINEEKKYFEDKYHYSQTTKELPFCIAMPGRNNVAYGRYKLALNSILIQEYRNYKVIIVDDASEDSTVQKVK